MSKSLNLPKLSDRNIFLDQFRLFYLEKFGKLNKYSDELEKDEEEPNATEDSIERQIQQVIEKGIEDDEKEKSSQADHDDDDRKSDSKSNKSDSSDDEMERLRKEALSMYNKNLRELINSFQVQKIVPDEDIRAQDQVEVIEIDGRPDVIVANRDQTATMMR